MTSISWKKFIIKFIFNLVCYVNMFLTLFITTIHWLTHFLTQLQQIVYFKKVIKIVIKNSTSITKIKIKQKNDISNIKSMIIVNLFTTTLPVLLQSNIHSCLKCAVNILLRPDPSGQWTCSSSASVLSKTAAAYRPL